MSHDVDSSFTEFVIMRGPALKRTALLLVGDPYLAEDALQTALAKASLKWRKINALDQPDAYVHRMVINASRSLMRRPFRRHEVTSDEVTDSATPDVQLEDRQMLLHCLRRLPPRQRAVIVLRFYEDLTEQQTADVLGCTRGTVKSQTFKALSALRRSMPAEFPGPLDDDHVTRTDAERAPAKGRS